MCHELEISKIQQYIIKIPSFFLKSVNRKLLFFFRGSCFFFSFALAPSSSMSDECQCDEVLRPMFWHDFLPSYLACQADLVCLLTRMRWMTAKGEINAFGAISTFRRANPSWYTIFFLVTLSVCLSMN